MGYYEADGFFYPHSNMKFKTPDGFCQYFSSKLFPVFRNDVEDLRSEIHSSISPLYIIL